MKSPDEQFINQFGRYELSQYALSSRLVKDLQAEKEAVSEMLYDEISPKMTYTDYDIGRCYAVSASVEDIALDIIEVKEGYDRRMARYQDKAQMFDVAMTSLSPRELDVIRVHYFDGKNNLGLSEEYFAEILHEAQDKLCSYIGQARLTEIEEKRKQRKESLRKQVAESKGHRVHVS
jgi:hypothetical protein